MVDEYFPSADKIRAKVQARTRRLNAPHDGWLKQNLTILHEFFEKMEAAGVTFPVGLVIRCSFITSYAANTGILIRRRGNEIEEWYVQPKYWYAINDVRLGVWEPTELLAELATIVEHPPVRQLD